jgi:1,4-alpha-glucan branching enzyme
MTVGTAKTYSTRRFVAHIQRFTKIYESIMRGSIDEQALKDAEWRDNIFPKIDYRAFSTDEERKAFNSAK